MVLCRGSNGDSVLAAMSVVVPWVIACFALVGMSIHIDSGNSITWFGSNGIATLLIALLPLGATALYLALAFVDWLIEVQVKFVTSGRHAPRHVIFSRLFAPLTFADFPGRLEDIIPYYIINKQDVEGLEFFNYANFLGLISLLTYIVCLAVLLPQTMWILLAGGIWIAVLYLARSVFNVKEKLGTHIEDPNAHKENK